MIYYLNSRYYNSEWGRFINGDSIAADAGELLSGNMFAYCKNNPVNMEDDDGTRPMPINGDQSPEITQVSCEIMNSWVQRTYHPSTYHPSSSSSYNILSSAGKSTASGIADGVGKKTAGKIIKDSMKWVSDGTLAMGKYVCRPGIIGRASKKILGNIGMAVFSAKDIISDIYHKQTFGLLVDSVSAAGGIGAGMVIEGIGAAIISAFAFPEILVGAGVFIAGILGGMAIDYFADLIKDKHYRRE